MTPLQQKFEDSLDLMKGDLQAEAQEAIDNLLQVSETLGLAALGMLQQLHLVMERLLKGEIDEDSASIAIDNYVEAISLLGQVFINAERVDAYKRGVKLLERFIAVISGLAQVALAVALPGLGTLLGGIVHGVMNEVTNRAPWEGPGGGINAK